MSNKFVLRKEQFDAATSQFKNAASDFTSQLQSTLNDISSHGQPWGHQEQGSAFSDTSGYNDAAESLHNAIKLVSDVFTGMAQMAEQTSRILTEQDESNKKTVTLRKN